MKQELTKREGISFTLDPDEQEMEIVEQDGVKRKSRTIIQQGPVERLNNLRVSIRRTEAQLTELKKSLKEKKARERKLNKLLNQIDEV